MYTLNGSTKGVRHQHNSHIKVNNKGKNGALVEEKHYVKEKVM